MLTADLLARFRQWIRGDDSVEFSEEEWRWACSAEAQRYLILRPIDHPAFEES